LGAEEVFDYRGRPWEEVSGEFDVVFDSVGGETFRRSWAVLREGGRMVTIAADGENTADQRRKAAFFIVEARGEELEEIGRRMERGKLRAVVDAVVSWGEAGEAYRGHSKRTGRGKVVVGIP
jgi:NADPH:quinone reductase-like Zn-dependent oxidoreductase